MLLAHRLLTGHFAVCLLHLIFVLVIIVCHRVIVVLIVMLLFYLLFSDLKTFLSSSCHWVHEGKHEVGCDGHSWPPYTPAHLLSLTVISLVGIARN